MPIKAIVCGGRDFNNYEAVADALSMVAKVYNITTIVQGGARGADLLARKWAVDKGIPFEQYDAEWDKYGKTAGLIRNQQMLDESGATIVVAFPGGNGTYDMVTRARRTEGVTIVNIVDVSK